MLERQPKATSLSVSNGIRTHTEQGEYNAEERMDTIGIEPAPYCESMPDGPALSIRRIWEARDGTPVLLRAIEHGDLEIERDLVDRLSSQSRYMRLMSARKPTDDEMVRWTCIDRQREGAVIATIWAGGHERLIGVARYAMNDGESDIAECAIVIDDAWHRQGLGRALLSSLIDLAGRSGIKRMVGTTLSENDAMIGLARSLGFSLFREAGVAFVTNLRLDLDARHSALPDEA
ncbi:GNAT family N-acetyltransferase [Burkholderia pyrrocinia]|uniref:GNAT family N-acetyltransferase n=1 Tax=Burkholderia pyrrocinia TaxID=60550 RepID=A0A2Z5MTX6_BURPY|nr:GNAT family N-acetyltransferase [Burkholderia pyrrocinia]AXF20715.1 GNAT family N-acetyltransferase [Burkholderia pyrrocinia]